MKTLIFDAFGTLFEVSTGGSAKTIMKHITDCGGIVDEKAFHEEWKSYYKSHTAAGCKFMTEREIFTARNRMFYDRYHISREAEADADILLAAATMRTAYPETGAVLGELMKHHQVFIGSNTDNDILKAVMNRNAVSVHKVYTSENLKSYKPNRSFFEKILAENNLSPEDVLFIGDSVSDDVLGPMAVGIRTVWVDRNKTGGVFGQDYTVTDLKDLLCGIVQP